MYFFPLSPNENIHQIYGNCGLFKNAPIAHKNREKTKLEAKLASLFMHLSRNEMSAKFNDLNNDRVENCRRRKIRITFTIVRVFHTHSYYCWKLILLEFGRRSVSFGSSSPNQCQTRRFTLCILFIDDSINGESFFCVYYVLIYCTISDEYVW